jgi:hypothetical protein
VSAELSSGVGHLSELGQLFEARGRSWAEAIRIRELAQQLSKSGGGRKGPSIQVKLYPPYPPDEPPQAATIRRFNGITAEVERIEATVRGDEDIPAVGVDGDETVWLVSPEADPHAESEALAESVTVGNAFRTTKDATLVRWGEDVLRQLA